MTHRENYCRHYLQKKISQEVLISKREKREKSQNNLYSTMEAITGCSLLHWADFCRNHTGNNKKKKWYVWQFCKHKTQNTLSYNFNFLHVTVIWTLTIMSHFCKIQHNLKYLETPNIPQVYIRKKKKKIKSLPDISFSLTSFLFFFIIFFCWLKSPKL